MNWEVIIKWLPRLSEGALLTLELVAIAVVAGLILAIPMGIARSSRHWYVRALPYGYIFFFRGTPLLVQLFLIHYGLPQVLSVLTQIDGVSAAIMGLTLHFSAYMAESIRAAILGVDRSQWEAAQSIGMTRGQMMRRIVLPQAARIAAPTLVNYFIDMIKGTSLAFTLGVTEMMGATQKEAAGSFLYFEAFLVVAVIYWILVEALSLVQRLLETHLNKAYAR